MSLMVPLPISLTMPLLISLLLSLKKLMVKSLTIHLLLLLIDLDSPTSPFTAELSQSACYYTRSVQTSRTKPFQVKNGRRLKKEASTKVFSCLCGKKTAANSIMCLQSCDVLEHSMVTILRTIPKKSTLSTGFLRLFMISGTVSMAQSGICQMVLCRNNRPKPLKPLIRQTRQLLQSFRSMVKMLLSLLVTGSRSQTLFFSLSI